MTIANPNTAANGTATVVLSAAGNGTLSNLGGGHARWQHLHPSAEAPAAIQSALRGLMFTPTPHEVAPGQTASHRLHPARVGRRVRREGHNLGRRHRALRAPIVSLAVAENAGAAAVGIAPTDRAGLHRGAAHDRRERPCRQTARSPLANGTAGGGRAGADQPRS